MPHPVQLDWIQRVRTLAEADPRVVAALTYGSFTKGEGDRYSDIEFWLFVQDADLERLNRHAWVSAVAPTVAVLGPLPGGLTVALYAGLVRGEFHFASASQLATIRSWAENGPFPNPKTMLLMDRTGGLRGHLQFLHDHPPQHRGPTEVQPLIHSFINWAVQGRHLLRRGEYARALNTLGTLHVHLLQLARLAEGTTVHWPTPSKAAEHELSPGAYARFARCTARLEPVTLETAYAESWDWARELIQALPEASKLPWPTPLDRPFSELGLD